MAQVKFILTMAEDGRCRSFSQAAWQIWQSHGSLVGPVLRPESALTLAEILVACREYLHDYPESGTDADLNEAYIASCLLELCQVGMVAIVIEPENESQRLA